MNEPKQTNTDGGASPSTDELGVMLRYLEVACDDPCRCDYEIDVSRHCDMRQVRECLSRRARRALNEIGPIMREAINDA